MNYFKIVTKCSKLYISYRMFQLFSINYLRNNEIDYKEG